jgi:hypothetical protein
LTLRQALWYFRGDMMSSIIMEVEVCAGVERSSARDGSVAISFGIGAAREDNCWKRER